MPVTREQILWSLAYWGVWVFVLFVVPELVGWEKLTPLRTLSGTVDWTEKGRPLLADAIFWFVVGVAVHWRFGTKFGRTESAAMIFALTCRFVVGF